MAFIHSKGIAHLDLKTANVLLSADRRSTVIADFGISQTLIRGAPVFDRGAGVEMMTMIGGPRPALSALALTPQYCAPERLLRDDLSFDALLAADVYTYGMKQGAAWKWSCGVLCA